MTNRFVARGERALAGIACALMAMAAPARAEPSAEDLAKLSQNPVGNLISVPFQYNANLNAGPMQGTQDVLNIQPVVPVSINSDWNLITRTIIPVISQPAYTPLGDRVNGVGDVQLTGFLSPANPGEWIWGAGLVTQLPTHTNSELGNDHWGLGPTFVVLHLDKQSPWVYGVLVNNIWSVGGGGSSPSYNNGLIQYFVNYNLPGGMYFTTSPINTVNWKAASGQKWTVPIGGGVGKIFHFGRLPVNMSVAAYYNVQRPDNASNWQIRAQVQFMFPK